LPKKTGTGKGQNGRSGRWRDEMPESVVYNCDCMEYMKSLPDNAFELAVVDPPYGAGFTEGGGCKGWFSKYHQNNDDRSQNVQVERERDKGSDATSENDGTDTIRTSCGNGSTGTTLRFHGGGKKDPWKKYLELHESRNRNGKKS
jgi:hypothetical protein